MTASKKIRYYTAMEGEPKVRKEESPFQFIDRKSPEILESLAQAPIYKKQGHVMARLAIPGEQITTTFANGTKETTNQAEKGNWIITNPAGEQYIISEKKFLSRYEKTDKEGVYAAMGFIRAIPNPYSKPIKIMASWGSPQVGDEKCMIADTCDENGECSNEPYLIDGDAFADTYKPIEK